MRLFYRCILFCFFYYLTPHTTGEFANYEGSTATEKMQADLSVNFC